MAAGDVYGPEDQDAGLEALGLEYIQRQMAEMIASGHENKSAIEELNQKLLQLQEEQRKREEEERQREEERPVFRIWEVHPDVQPRQRTDQSAQGFGPNSAIGLIAAHLQELVRGGVNPAEAMPPPPIPPVPPTTPPAPGEPPDDDKGFGRNSALGRIADYLAQFWSILSTHTGSISTAIRNWAAGGGRTRRRMFRRRRVAPNKPPTMEERLHKARRIATDLRYPFGTPQQKRQRVGPFRRLFGGLRRSSLVRHGQARARILAAGAAKRIGASRVGGKMAPAVQALGNLASRAQAVVGAFIELREVTQRMNDQFMARARQYEGISPSISAALAERDVQQLMLDIRRGERVSESTEAYTESEQYFQRSYQEAQTAFERIANYGATAFNMIAGTILNGVDILFKPINAILDLLEGAVDREKGRTVQMGEWMQKITQEKKQDMENARRDLERAERAGKGNAASDAVK